MRVRLGVLASPPPAELVVKHAEPRVEAALRTGAHRSSSWRASAHTLNWHRPDLSSLGLSIDGTQDQGSRFPSISKHKRMSPGCASTIVLQTGRSA